MNEQSPHKRNKRICQYVGCLLLVVGILKLGAFKASASSDILLGSLLLFSVSQNSIPFVLFFHYFALLETVTSIADLFDDIQRDTLPFSETGTSEISLKWTVILLTVIVRIVAMFFGFKLYQSIKAAQYGFIDSQDISLDFFPQYQPARAEATTFEEQGMQIEPKQFKAFGGRGTTIGI